MNQRQAAESIQEFLVLFPQVAAGLSPDDVDCDTWSVARVALPGVQTRYRLDELSRRMAPWTLASASAPPSSLVVSTQPASGSWMAELEAAAAACGSAVETLAHDAAAATRQQLGPYFLPSGLRVLAAGGGIAPDASTLVIDQGLVAGPEWQRAAALCMYALDIFASMEGPARVLDVDTGCGAVALVAERRGATHVVAVDSDPYARFVARRNVRTNRSSVELAAAIPDERFDIVISGLGPHAFAPELMAALRPGGLLIQASHGQDQDQAAEVARPGLRLVCHLRDDDFGVDVSRRV